MLRTLVLVVLITSSMVSFADQPTHNVIIPQNSTIKYLGENDGTYKFQGQMQLTGLLKARWGKDLPGDKPNKKIYLQFLPTEKQATLLPTINDQYRNSNQMVLLNSEKSLESNKKIVEANFKDIPATFWKNQEGILQQPMTIIIDNFKANDDCDYRYYYANIVSIKTVADIEPVIQERRGCNSYIFEDIYMIHSKEGYTNLRKEANGKSIVIQKLTNDTLVNKVRIEGNWYYINVLNAGEQTDINGYVHNSQVIRAD
ncbi:hypothetical protein [Gilliamella sp. wkB112]|uniref:hypothetical protein n=1 Tax=Gilliamella sp. wkB112 TaxID=3120257 RepID=UPI00080E2E45|nr:hypothetical protein [Gilliamella apicola]OCG02330.1 hypothetical protein A9G12_11565 [Gilliamella apicola]